jgi:hypothetical protein
MDDTDIKPAVAAWATRGLPARLDAAAAAKLLGFAEHDIQVLMRVGKLIPLGDPAPNAPKWFAGIELVRLATDRDWLHRASREISRYWRSKRERQVKTEANSEATMIQRKRRNEAGKSLSRALTPETM